MPSIRLITLSFVGTFAACASAPTPAAEPIPVAEDGLPANYPRVDVPSMKPGTAALLDTVAPETAEAFVTLRRSQLFEDVAIGMDGHTSESVIAYRVLAADPRADDLFAKLAFDGSLIGRLYGTIGLYERDRQLFTLAVSSMRAEADTLISKQTGCILSGARLGEILDREHFVHDGKVIRLAAGQSLDQWFATHKSGYPDVVGGAYHAMFEE